MSYFIIGYAATMHAEKLQGRSHEQRGRRFSALPAFGFTPFRSFGKANLSK